MNRSSEQLARIEQHAVRAWPAPVSREVDGWLLRHTPGMRRLRAGAQWATDHGARGLYLQVERANPAAQHVYARAGFSHAYDYHYRVAAHREQA